MQFSKTHIPLLEHGYARLVSYMQPVEHDPSYDPGIVAGLDLGKAPWTGDLEVIRNARTSYDATWRTGVDAGKDEKLIHRLYRDRHTSPFEAMVFTFEIKAPLFVFRQWHRHRTWAYSEVSARYAELPAEFYIPAAQDVTTQHSSNKQMRTDETVQNVGLAQAFMTKSNADAFALYNTLLGQGVARELARTVLPVSTYSRMFATVDLHNLFHFLRLRLHEHAQMEIRVYAEALLELISPIVPHAVAAFEESRNV